MSGEASLLYGRGDVPRNQHFDRISSFIDGEPTPNLRKEPINCYPERGIDGIKQLWLLDHRFERGRDVSVA
jgi:hypothetical protein